MAAPTSSLNDPSQAQQLDLHLCASRNLPSRDWPLTRSLSSRHLRYHSSHCCSCADIGAKIEVLHSKVEDLSDGLGKVDVLVSEPMGTLLVNERMLETYLYARDRFLRPGGRMFPVRTFGTPQQRQYKIPQPHAAVTCVWGCLPWSLLACGMRDVCSSEIWGIAGRWAVPLVVRAPLQVLHLAARNNLLCNLVQLVTPYKQLQISSFVCQSHVVETTSV